MLDNIGPVGLFLISLVAIFCLYFVVQIFSDDKPQNNKWFGS
jgi:hypothetical protein